MLLTGPYRRKTRRSTPRRSAVATVVCLALLALVAVIQVAHVHPLVTDADHCPLCIAMHAVAPVVAPAAVIILLLVGTPALILEPRAILHHWHPSLFTRPPPPSW